MAATIKRGVSLYSFQHEVFLGLMTLEDGIRVATEMGAPAIEIIAEQTFWNYPEKPFVAGDIERWHSLLKKYNAIPIAHDFMLDYRRYKGREMPFDEQVASVKRDIDTGVLLGTPYIRALVSIAPEVLVAAAPYAEEKGIKILLEVHAPFHFDHPWVVRHAEAYEKSGSHALGFQPDTGMFTEHFPGVWKERFIRNGVPQKIADYIVKAYEDRVAGGYVALKVREMGGVGPSLGMAETLNHNFSFEPKRMLDFMPRIHHIHGKFYEMNEDGTDPCIAFPKVIEVLKQGGYDGYICSEYEGNRWVEDAQTVDSVKQVRLQQDMLKRLIAAPVAKPTQEKMHV